MARYDQPLPPDAPRIPAARARKRLGRMMMLAKPEWRSLLVGLFCLAIASGANLAFPQAIRVLVDGALASGTHGVDRAAVLIATLGVLAAAASAVRFIVFTVAGERIVARLRRDAYERLIDQEIAFFDKHKIGDLTSRLASDTTVLQNAVSVNLSMMLRNTASATGGVAMLFFTSWKLTLLMLAVVPAIALGAVMYGRRVRRLSRDVQDALGHASSIGEESLVGIRTVRTFAAERVEARRYGDAVDKSFELAKRRNVITGTFMGVAMAASTCAVGVVMGYGGRLVATHAMSVGQLTSFLVYTIVVAFSLGALGDLWADFMRAAGAAERVFEVIDRVPEIASEGGESPSEVRGEISIEHVDLRVPARAPMHKC